MATLSRKLGLFSTTMYGVGLILGAGIYVLIGAAAGHAGDAMWMSFTLAAIVSVFTGLSYAELASLFPKAAAEYVYVKNVFKNNFLAFIIGWLVLFTAIIAVSTIALGFASYLSTFIAVPLVIMASLLIVILSVVNFLGIKESSGMNILFTLIEAAGLVLIIVLGMTFVGDHEVNFFESPFGMQGIFAAFLLVFFAYIGFENIANIAEETKNPTKTIPRAIILSIIITSIIYILVAVSASSLIPWEELTNSPAPLADAAAKVMGKDGHLTLSIIALFATTNTVLIMSVAASRILYGISAGKSLPNVLGRIHQKRNTPWVAILACMIIAIGFTMLGDIETVANITVFTIVLIFAMVNLTVIWLRLKHKGTVGGFRTPGSILGVPIIPILGFASSVAGVLMFDFSIVGYGCVVILAGVLFYIIYRKLSGTIQTNTDGI